MKYDQVMQSPTEKAGSSFMHAVQIVRMVEKSHLWHSRLALESPSHSVVNALGLSPAWVNAFEAIALVPVKARSVCRCNPLAMAPLVLFSTNFIL
jgi:hypothetical protein